MKKLFLFVPIFLMVSMINAEAAFVSGSTGADGAFNPTANTALQLPPGGIFNFTTVNIPSGVTVTFQSNAANTPVYILATGDVTIAGTVSVNGGAASSTTPGIGGPGGYNGGYNAATGNSGGQGMGPGRGGGGNTGCDWGGGGGFGTSGTGNCGAGGPSYGNVRLLPLIGGSGGGGGALSRGSGAGGGGAILIASSTTIAITGSITSNGGSGYNYGGGGSGGAIKLMANTISGNGVISATGGSYAGGAGRIRLEFFTNDRTASTNPTYTMGQPGNVFVANAPSLAITSIAGVSVPSNPTGSYMQPDILLPNTTANPLAVNLSALNIPVGTTVTVSAIPLNGSATDVTTTLSGTEAASTASANVTVSTQYANVIMAKATFTLQTAMYYEGEKIDKVKVAAVLGGESSAVYVTERGREIPAEKLLASLMQ